MVTEPRGPNMVLALADDMGYGDFGCFNYGISRTPTLDHLVDDGLCLTQHYSASPICSPARASLLTGRYPHRTGAIDTWEVRGTDRFSLREHTIGDVFQAAGYVTGLVGKWHNGAIDPRFHPNNRGFTEFAGFRGGWADYYDWRLDRNGSLSQPDGRYLTDVLAQEAIDFVTRHRNERFFLHLAFNAPHFPFQAPDPVLKPYVDTGAFTTATSTIYAMVEVMDRALRRVLEALDDLGIGDDTLFMFSSDNGPQMLGRGDESTHRFNCGFNGAKGLVYEGGIRLPMVMRWPNGLSGGVVHDLVHFTDWLPTLASLAGAPLPEGVDLDGIDVSPLLRGERGTVVDRRFWQWNRYTPRVECNAAMRDGDWKLVRPWIAELFQSAPGDMETDEAFKRHQGDFETLREPLPAPEFPDPPAPQLFNIRNDPLEQRDLAGRDPERVRRMLADLETWFERMETERRAIPQGEL